MCIRSCNSKFVYSYSPVRNRSRERSQVGLIALLNPLRKLATKEEAKCYRVVLTSDTAW